MSNPASSNRMNMGGGPPIPHPLHSTTHDPSFLGPGHYRTTMMVHHHPHGTPSSSVQSGSPSNGTGSATSGTSPLMPLPSITPIGSAMIGHHHPSYHLHPLGHPPSGIIPPSPPKPTGLQPLSTSSSSSATTLHPLTSATIPAPLLVPHPHKRLTKSNPAKKKRPKKIIPNNIRRNYLCNDCTCKFIAKFVAGRSVQHYCAFYGKTITRKIETKSSKCAATHHEGACIKKIELGSGSTTKWIDESAIMRRHKVNSRSLTEIDLKKQMNLSNNQGNGSKRGTRTSSAKKTNGTDGSTAKRRRKKSGTRNSKENKSAGHNESENGMNPHHPMMVHPHHPYPNGIHGYAYPAMYPHPFYNGPPPSAPSPNPAMQNGLTETGSEDQIRVIVKPRKSTANPSASAASAASDSPSPHHPSSQSHPVHSPWGYHHYPPYGYPSPYIPPPSPAHSHHPPISSPNGSAAVPVTPSSNPAENSDSKASTNRQMKVPLSVPSTIEPMPSSTPLEPLSSSVSASSVPSPPNLNPPSASQSTTPIQSKSTKFNPLSTTATPVHFGMPSSTTTNQTASMSSGSSSSASSSSTVSMPRPSSSNIDTARGRRAEKPGMPSELIKNGNRTDRSRSRSTDRKERLSTMQEKDAQRKIRESKRNPTQWNPDFVRNLHTPKESFIHAQREFHSNHPQNSSLTNLEIAMGIDKKVPSIPVIPDSSKMDIDSSSTSSSSITIEIPDESRDDWLKRMNTIIQNVQKLAQSIKLNDNALKIIPICQKLIESSKFNHHFFSHPIRIEISFYLIKSYIHTKEFIQSEKLLKKLLENGNGMNLSRRMEFEIHMTLKKIHLEMNEKRKAIEDLKEMVDLIDEWDDIGELPPGQCGIDGLKQEIAQIESSMH